PVRGLGRQHYAESFVNRNHISIVNRNHVSRDLLNECRFSSPSTFTGTVYESASQVDRLALT
ncbi:MAG: hypothetical protein ACK56F_06700, partial [bacterium]